MSDTDKVSADAFNAVTALIALIALITDPKACAKRLAELTKAAQEVAAGQAQLAADREAHEREVAEAKAGLDRRGAELTELSYDLHHRKLRPDNARMPP
jgi:hypothetical protein